MKLDNLKIIDWNDDVFVAIGSLNESWYTFVLRAKEFDTDQKVYFSIKMEDDEISKKLLKLVNEDNSDNWNEITSFLNKIHENEKGFLFIAKNLKNDIEISLDVEFFEKITFPLYIGSFYEMNIEEREEWFDRAK